MYKYCKHMAWSESQKDFKCKLDKVVEWCDLEHCGFYAPTEFDQQSTITGGSDV